MGYVTTSVKIDEDKRALAKQRGIKLQDLLDEALNMALQLEVEGKAQLEIEKDELFKDLEILDRKKEEYLEKYQHNVAQINLKIDLINKELEAKDDEEQHLEQQREYQEFINFAIEDGAIDDILEDIQQYAYKYDLEFNEVVKQIMKDAYE